MKWNANGNYSQSLACGNPDDGFIVANVSYVKESSRRGYIMGDVVCDVFPKVERRDFVTLSDARDWCEKWVGFAVELIQARKTIAIKQQQAQEDFQTIMALREELHTYKYPHTTEEVNA